MNYLNLNLTHALVQRMSHRMNKPDVDEYHEYLRYDDHITTALCGMSKQLDILNEDCGLSSPTRAQSAHIEGLIQKALDAHSEFYVCAIQLTESKRQFFANMDRLVEHDLSALPREINKVSDEADALIRKMKSADSLRAEFVAQTRILIDSFMSSNLEESQFDDEDDTAIAEVRQLGYRYEAVCAVLAFYEDELKHYLRNEIMTISNICDLMRMSD